ncbi:hypothetical protein N7519_003149 [Penicillium mononematosum]|uniref:uncharacterized protein n=1 Tax=Penicillium mononematosum TaxID=268346 RepID=UPI0025489BFF|nr:uncharacterized protein N7519_003149 [Penicillium mononematosum]KAJ6188241.1 hypothetical protein N7519_003149 [Penicillium mononematosum]
MDENAAEKLKMERRKKWDMAYKARMRQIVPGLFLGNVRASHRREMLQENHINAIVSLTTARWVWWNSTTRNAGVPEHRHKWIQCADSSTQDLLAHMNDICEPSEAILIHCDLGISRSPTIIIAYLMRKLKIQQADVLRFVQSKQRIQPSANFTRQLQVWEEVGYKVWEDEDKTVPKAAYKAFLEDRAALLKEKGLMGDEPLAPLTL